MGINCLSTQEDLFETRLLRRVSQPVFLAVEALPGGLDAPLVLYGNWHSQGFWNGLRWLSGLVFRLPYPCILLPPFETGSLGDVLGLTTALSVQTANTNRLTVLPEADVLNLAGKGNLQVQTDYAFSGPTGKAWLTAVGTPLAAVTFIQPKNTSTPLILCGARLLSTSGLSDNDDRLALLEGIIAWAGNWRASMEQPIEAPAYLPQLDDPIWHVVCIVVAGSRMSTANEIVSLARSLFGIEISSVDMQLAHNRLVENGFAQRKGDDLEFNLPALETYTQQIGLWAYVRALRKDFERIRP
jgi:hypothetical protein